MNEAIGSFIAEHFEIIIFVSGLIWSFSKFHTTQKDFQKNTNKEFLRVREYIDLKTFHVDNQIEDIKKSIDSMTDLVQSMCRRMDKIIDR